MEGTLSIIVAQELAPLRRRRFITISELTQPIPEFFSLSLIFLYLDRKFFIILTEILFNSILNESLNMNNYEAHIKKPLSQITKSAATRTWQNIRSISRILPQHVCLNLCTFHSHPPLNNNAEAPKFAWSENGNSDRELLTFPFAT